MTALIATCVIAGSAIGLVAAFFYYVVTRKGPSTAEREAVDDLAESLGVMSDLDGLPGPDGSHDNLDDCDGVRWAEEVMWLTEMYEADEVPIVPGREHRLPGEAS